MSGGGAAAPTGPLAGRCVVVTRAAADAAPLLAALRARGAAVVAVPSVRLQALSGPADRAAIAAAVAALGEVDWLAFASRHGAEHFTAALAALGAAVPARCALAAVGPATAAAVRRLFGRCELVAEPASGAGLAAALLARPRPAGGPPPRVLLPAAQDGRLEATAALRAGGWRATRLPVYHTVPLDAAVPVALPATVHYVLFTSPSTVQGFVGRGPWPAGARAVSIGPTTSAALRQHGLAVAREARPHTVEGLLRALEEDCR